MKWRNMEADPPPPNTGDILGWSKYSGVTHYYLSIGAGWVPADNFSDDATHWMPLPPPPEADNDH